MRILHFGDSHLVAPAASGTYGDFFRNTYGDGGPGLGLPWTRAMGGIRAEASKGWRKFGWKNGDRGVGLGGAYLEARRPGEWARLEGRFSRVRIHFLRQPEGGRVRITLDGKALEDVDLGTGSGPVRVFDHSTGDAPRVHRLELLTRNAGPVRILDVALEGRSGTTHSVLAFNGAAAAWLAETPAEILSAALRSESPDLVMLAFGTNEANDADFEPSAYQGRLESVLGRFQKAAPGAAFVLVGPPDGRLKRGSAKILEQVIQVQRAVAARMGALFVDRQQAMGGAGSIQAWQQEGLAQGDLVHLTPPGYTRLARAMISDLWSQLGQEAHFQAGPGPAARPPAPPLPPSEPRAAGIYVFRTADGRTFIVDDPRKVAGLEGEWIGEKP